MQRQWDNDYAVEYGVETVEAVGALLEGEPPYTYAFIRCAVIELIRALDVYRLMSDDARFSDLMVDDAAKVVFSRAYEVKKQLPRVQELRQRRNDAAREYNEQHGA